MKFLLIYLFFTLLLMAQESPFSLRKKDTTGELEAKIVTQIAADVLYKNVTIYVSGETKDFIPFCVENIKITKNCQEANFIFISKQSDSELCENKKAIHFTDNRELFSKNKEFVGLFQWLKGRPNITFSSSRILTKQLTLPKSYEQFIEEF